MKDEIKEILDNTLEYLEGIDETRNTKILTTNETNILLDYITNLQEEKRKLKAELELYKDNHNYLNDRIDKAIEYIKKHCDYGYAGQKCLTDVLYHYEAEELLEILQGKSDE